MLSGAHAAHAAHGARPGLLYHEPHVRSLYDEDGSSDEYGSCTEAPLYENVNEDEEEAGVYENVDFEQPAYSNLLGGLIQEDEVYANVPALEEAPTYDVPQPQRRPLLASPQEYANLPAPQPAPQPAQQHGNGGLGVILEECESSARSTSGSSCNSSSIPTLSRIRGGACGASGASGAAPRPGCTPKEVVFSHTRTTNGQTNGQVSRAYSQATPERLARVQGQVREHLLQPQQKLSVRDLLGHFESGRAAAGPMSYGFGGSTAKNALRKAISQPPAATNHYLSQPSPSAPPTATAATTTTTVSNGGSRLNGSSSSCSNNSKNSSSNSRNSSNSSNSSYSSNSNSSYSSNNNINNNKFAGATPTGSSSNNSNSSYSSNNNNKFAGATPTVSGSSSNNNNSNASRKSFLDSIIAAGAGDAPQRSSMEEKNNLLNSRAAAKARREGKAADLAADLAANLASDLALNHPALRKANSTSSLMPSRSKGGGGGGGGGGGVRKGARENGGAQVDRGSSQDIPSIVDQLPDDDPPQESRRTTSHWDPAALVTTLYSVPEPLRDKPRPVDRVNVEGFLERLPSGRTKATFWNAWKRCYFRAKDGFLYCYAGKHSDKPMDVTQLMGGHVETFESMVITAQDRNPATVPMIGIDDRMSHYLVVRAGSQQETDRWMQALRTHTVEDFSSTYVQPWPVPRAPALLRDSIVVDLGSRSVRAGILCSQPSLPQLFFPALCASRRGLAGLAGERQVFGSAALQPSVRASSTLTYPIRPTERINKHTVDLGAVSGLLRVVFQSLSVEPRDYGVILSVPRTLDAATQSRLVAELFDRFGVRSVLLSHQSVLALYAYNAGSGVVVDIGERTDVVPIMDGYIVEGGVSRVPYGGEEMVGHVRRLLLQRAPPPVSLGTVAEALLPRLALERLCFVSSSYRTDLRRAQRDPTDLTASVSVSEYFAGDKGPTMESLTLDAGRFQAPEGLFHPQAWGLDNPGVHRMVHKAIQECSMDARKTMARSVFLAGGLTMLPGFTERLREELAALLPAAAQPKVHASPYRYHAAYLGACVLANSSGVQEMCLTREEYTRDGSKLLRPWIL